MVLKKNRDLPIFGQLIDDLRSVANHEFKIALGEVVKENGIGRLDFKYLIRELADGAERRDRPLFPGRNRNDD